MVNRSHHDGASACGAAPEASAGGAIDGVADRARGSAITLRDVTVSYRGHPAVHHVSGQVQRGLLTAIVGPNGAGKSSLLAVLQGQLAPGQGRVEPAPGLRMACLPQRPTLEADVPLQVQDLVALGLWHRCGALAAWRSAEQAQVALALQAVGLAGFERRWTAELSAGQLQRALFARLLLQDADLILLDEPFNAVDARTTAELLTLLQRWRAEGRTVVAVLHDLEQVRQHFDHTLLLAREMVAWGPTADVLTPWHLDQARHMAEAWDEQAPWCRPAA